MPITWKNINNPNFSASNNLLVQGGNSIADAFDSVVKYGDKIDKQKLEASIRARDNITKDLTDRALQGGIEQQNNINESYPAQAQAELAFKLAQAQGQKIKNDQSPLEFALRQKVDNSSMSVNKARIKQMDNNYQINKDKLKITKDKFNFDKSSSNRDFSLRKEKFIFDKNDPRTSSKARPTLLEVRMGATAAILKDNPNIKQADLNKKLLMAGIPPIKTNEPKGEFKRNYKEADIQQERAKNISNGNVTKLNVLINKAKLDKVDPRVLALAISKSHKVSWAGDDDYLPDNFNDIIKKYKEDKADGDVTAEEALNNAYNDK